MLSFLGRVKMFQTLKNNGQIIGIKASSEVIYIFKQNIMKGDITEKDIKHENPRQTMQKHGKSWSYRDRKKDEKARSRKGEDKTGKCRTGHRMDNKEMTGQDRQGRK
jgi:hypothetical protein